MNIRSGSIVSLLICCATVLFMAAFGGCSTTNPNRSAEITAAALAAPVYKYVVVKPGEALLADCDVSAVPPDKERYLKMSQLDREIALAAYIRELQGDFGKCADKQAAYKEFFSKQEKLYEEKK